jgi:hypothetical protein
MPRTQNFGQAHRRSCSPAWREQICGSTWGVHDDLGPAPAGAQPDCHRPVSSASTARRCANTSLAAWIRQITAHSHGDRGAPMTSCRICGNVWLEGPSALAAHALICAGARSDSRPYRDCLTVDDGFIHPQQIRSQPNFRTFMVVWSVLCELEMWHRDQATSKLWQEERDYVGRTPSLDCR